MSHDDLIRQLASHVPAVPRRAAARRITRAIVVGGVITLGLVLLGLGVRTDITTAVATAPFWYKAAYTASFAICGVILLLQVARPDTAHLRWAWLWLVPLAVMGLACVLELARTPAWKWSERLMHPPWACPLIVLILSAPVFAGLVWAFRRLAPTNLPLAGAAIGLASGAVAATLYCLYCEAVSPLYIFTRYTLGIGLATAAGALVGPRMLRW
ncbi:DUF1109 domain-containing protein [Caulobacter sp. NIBR2454]|uniref:DUF1109 domain-containing protein n=1 Tax=Caulobacter sp. NIBR2454 TaxID=3015996 RepID=UPI0022B6A88B|nr:DUF1109 domain-containing protein [Caulobacter sp. NIBR2454]